MKYSDFLRNECKREYIYFADFRNPNYQRFRKFLKQRGVLFMFKKILAGLLVSIMAASLMAGCGENSNTVTPGETVTLAIWHSRAEDMDETSDHQR